MRRTILLGALAMLCAGCGGSPPPGNAAPERAGWPAEFRVGFFGGDDAEQIMTENEPIRAFLETRLGIPVKMTTGTSYTVVIEAMRARRVDAMEVGPFSYCLAVQEANAEALAVSVLPPDEHPKYDPDFPPYYLSCIFTRKGNGIRTLDDLRDKSFAFVDPASTSGNLSPRTLLKQHGIDPDKDLEARFAGSHPTAALAVAGGTAAAGATNEANLLNMQERGAADIRFWPDGKHSQQRTPEDFAALYDSASDGELVIIALSDPIPNTPFAVRADLPQSFKDALRAALLAVKDQPEIVASIKRWYTDPRAAFGVETLDAAYNPLREMAKTLNLDLKKLGG